MKQGSMVKRTLAALLCLVLVLSFVPGNLFTAYAAEADSTLWQQVGEIDKATGGKWEKAGYGDKLAVFFGAAEKAVTVVNEKVEAGNGDGGYFRGNDYHLYIVDGVPATYNANVHPKMVDTWSGYPGNMTVYLNDMLLDAPAGYTGNWPTFNGKIRPHVNKDFANEGFINYVNTVSIPAALTNPTHRSFIKCNGLDTTKEYLVTLYADSVGNSGEYTGNLCFSFTTTGGASLLSQTVVAASEFGKNGGYISFRVKGAFDLVIDQENNRNFGLSAVFFDEYVAPETLPENVFPEALTPWTFVETDTTTKGAWNTAGYGSYDAVLMGYGYKDALTLTNGKQVLNPNNDPNRNKFAYSAEGKVTTTGSWNEVFLYEATSTSEKNPVVETLYNPNPNAVATFDAYALGSSATTTVPNVSGLPDLAAEGNWCRRYFTFTGLEEGKQYVFRIYTNNNVTGYYANDTQDDLIVHFVDADGTVHKNVETFQSVSFNGGVYRAYIVEGDSFSLVIDSKNSRSTDNATGNTGATRFGLSGFFFDEYVAPAAPVTPEAPVTYENWQQVGNIDNYTGGAWETKGYGEVQAVLLGWNYATAENNGVLTQYAGYSPMNNPDRKSMSRWDAQLHLRSDSKIVATVSTGVPGNYAGILATRTDANGRLIPTLDAPKNYTGVIPQYNTYAWETYQMSNVAASATDILNSLIVKPAAADTAYRHYFKFTGLEADKEYIFTVYYDTANYISTAQPTGKVEFSFWDSGYTALKSTSYVTATANEFGSDGGYISFKVQGDFILSVDKADRFFAPSAFFFDECAVAEELAPPVWKFVDTDTTTKGAWNTAGYGSHDAVLLGYKYTGEVVAGDRKTFNSNQYTYVPNGKVSVSWPFTNEHYTIGSTGETGNNPLEETLYNPNTEVTNKFDVFYTAAFDGTHAVADDVPGYATLGNVETNWKRIYFTFSGLDADQYYLFRMYTNNNIAGFYKADVQDDVKIHLVEASGAVHNVETIQSRSFDGGVYRTYLVKGNFTIVIDKKVTRADGAADNAKSAGYWGPSGFFFDEYEAPAQDKVESASITLDGTIGVNYGVNLNVIAKQDKDAYMKLTQGDDVVTVRVADSEWKSKLNWFSKGVAAKEMADIVTAQMYYSDGTTGAANEYSVQKYANTVLNTTTVTAPMKELLVRMLNYGAYAQTYFNYNTANMANSALTREAKASGLATVSTEHLQRYLANCNDGTGNIKMSYASLLLKSETTLRLSFKTATINDTVAVVGGTDTVLPWVTRNGTSYSYVDITNIPAAELDETFTIDIVDLDTAQVVSTVSYCPLAYVYSAMTQSDDVNLINAVKSLYLYNQAANAYFA